MDEVVPDLVIQFYVLGFGKIPEQGLGARERKADMPRHEDLTAQIQSRPCTSTLLMRPKARPRAATISDTKAMPTPRSTAISIASVFSNSMTTLKFSMVIFCGFNPSITVSHVPEVSSLRPQ